MGGWAAPSIAPPSPCCGHVVALVTLWSYSSEWLGSALLALLMLPPSMTFDLTTRTDGVRIVSREKFERRHTHCRLKSALGLVRCHAFRLVLFIRLFLGRALPPNVVSSETWPARRAVLH